MNDPYRGLWLLFSHHRREEAHHTLRLRVGPWTVALCTRCTALYPSLLAVVSLEKWFGPAPASPRWFWVYCLVTPAVIDHSRAKLFSSHGTNFTRLWTGFFAGVGLGMGFSDYFRHQPVLYFWILLGLLGAGSLWLLLIRRGGRDPL